MKWIDEADFDYEFDSWQFPRNLIPLPLTAPTGKVHAHSNAS
jgi:hypothetical protein